MKIELLKYIEESYESLHVSAYERNGCLCLNLYFAERLFTKSNVENMLSMWKQVLVLIATNPDMRVADINLPPRYVDENVDTE